MEYSDKDTILDLEEDNKLLSSRIEIYKEEIADLKNKLDYARKFFVLYESIMEHSRNEAKELNDRVKRLEKEIEKLKNG